MPGERPRKYETCFCAICQALIFGFISVLFVGDDIFEGLAFTEVYQRFEEMHLLNFSIRADKIQNVLYRIMSGELENIKPKVSFRNLLNPADVD